MLYIIIEENFSNGYKCVHSVYDDEKLANKNFKQLKKAGGESFGYHMKSMKDS